jgi:hypothetical protein
MFEPSNVAMHLSATVGPIWVGAPPGFLRKCLSDFAIDSIAIGASQKNSQEFDDAFCVRVQKQTELIRWLFLLGMSCFTKFACQTL